MKNITIQVDPEIAKAYREAKPEKQQKIQIFLNIMLQKAVSQKRNISINAYLPELLRARASPQNDLSLEVGH